MAPNDPSPLKDLITANHILHNHRIVDAYGHISLRNPNNPHTFFLSHSVAPALVSSPSDIVEYNIEDASPVQEGVSEGYRERCIHSEILKKYPGVNSVVHSHSEAVLPYGISGVELKPCFHMAGFLGPHVPVFDIATHYNPTTPRHDLLVTTPSLGAALASHFAPTPPSYVALASTYLSTSITSITSPSTSTSTSTTNKSSPPSATTTTSAAAAPAHTVVLMRGHGFTALGSTVQEAVFRAIYTQQNAGVQTTAMMLRDVRMGAEERGKGREEREKGVRDEEGVRWLGEREMGDCREMGQSTVGRPWGLWVREVEANGLYVNEA